MKEEKKSRKEGRKSYEVPFEGSGGSRAKDSSAVFLEKLGCSRQEEEWMQSTRARASLETCLRSMKEAKELEAGD